MLVTIDGIDIDIGYASGGDTVIFLERNGETVVSASHSSSPNTWEGKARRWILRSTWTIELKLDIPEGDEQTKEILREALRSAAQVVLAQAIMVSDKRQPQVALRSETAFDGPEEFDLGL